jgi:DNA helicase-2/ATP-dependent DNA helicase PcrA
MMDLLSDLTPPQREAVRHVDGPLLVLAGAGSGKTRVVTRRVAHLLKQGIPGSEIVALTFTNKAAGEMRERLEKIVPGAGVWVGTFHGFCARLLRAHGPAIGLDRNFTIYDQSDRLRVIKAVMEENGVDNIGVSPERVENAISRAKNDLRTAGQSWGEEADHVSAVVDRVAQAYQARLLDSAAVDFDDLLTHVVTLLRQHKELRARLDAKFKYILVDEYQDTNLAQYAILKGLSVDHPNLGVTGDPDQSIYGWRGANLNNILEFERDFPGAKVVRLEQNYRSTKNILRVADHLIRFNKRRKPKSLITDNPEGSLVELITYRDETEEANRVAHTIAGLARDGGFSFGDMAVFVRVTALTRNLESAFRSARVPYQMVGGLSFYERQEIKDALAYLQLTVNPKDDIAFGRAIATPPRGIGKVSLERLQAYARNRGIGMLEAAKQGHAVPTLPAKAAGALRDFVLLMNELGQAKDLSAEEITRRMLAQSGYRRHWEDSKGENAEDRVANLDELVTAARVFDQEHPEATIVDFLQDISLASAVDQLKEEGGSVTLMTLHAAKGLEFPVVFIVGLEQGILPHSRSRESEAELEEERRLLFVGITRARQELKLSHCRIREFRGQRAVAIPSQFIGELPHESIEARDLAEPDYGALSASRRLPPPTSLAAGGRPRFVTAAALGTGTTESFTPSDDLAVFRAGVSVLHPEYGLGKIVSVDGAGPNRKGKVVFAVGGEKVFVLSKAPLRPLKPRGG